MSVLIVIFIIAFLLRFEVVAKMVSDLTGVDKDAIQDWAGIIAASSAGALILVAGIAIAGALPFVAAGLMIVGAAILIWQMVSVYNATKESGSGKRLG